jgi:ABC-2 type transport system ATP-binding protein
MQPVIEIQDLKMQYEKEKGYVLKGVNLEVVPGQIIGYIGPNGAGKSTTVKIMLGMLEGYEGSVKVFGKDIREDPVAYKRHIGYVPEAAILYDTLSGAEYMNFIGTLYGMSAETIDQKATELFDLFGIKSAYNNRIASYSKGMKQKLLIMASLIHNPDILFFDEPINGLDANSVMVFKEMLRKLAERGKTIFYSSHIMEVVEKISDRIVVLNQGIIVADGDFETLKDSSHEGTLQEIFNQLTGFEAHEEIANRFVEIITDEVAP